MKHLNCCVAWHIPCYTGTYHVTPRVYLLFHFICFTFTHSNETFLEGWTRNSFNTINETEGIMLYLDIFLHVWVDVNDLYLSYILYIHVNPESLLTLFLLKPPQSLLPSREVVRYYAKMNLYIFRDIAWTPLKEWLDETVLHTGQTLLFP